MTKFLCVKHRLRRSGLQEAYIPSLPLTKLQVGGRDRCVNGHFKYSEKAKQC